MKTPKNILKNKKNIETASSASYLAEDNNYTNFSAQLARLGLELRDITGDGNCCFRALSDQMHGTEEHHIEYRKRVCQYMKQSREEFEPFVAALIDEEELSSESSSGNRIGNFENG